MIKYMICYTRFKMEINNISKKGQILSFKYAFDGIAAAIYQEPNLKFHLIVATLVLLAGFLLGIKKGEWIIIVILIGFVLSLELTNSAIEAMVDSFTEGAHPGAKLAKDISAGAVLIAATTAAIVGLVIFLPYLL